MKRTRLAAMAAIVIAAGIGAYQIDTRPLFAPADRLGPGPHVQLWPHRHGTDAMFAAALKVV